MKKFLKVFFGICTCGTTILLGWLFTSTMNQTANDFIDSLPEKK